MLRQATTNHTILLLCLCLPALLLIRTQLGSAAGHMDEYDYLFVGKTLLATDHWPTHSYIFGWDVNWLILAWGDTVFGGLHGARIVASIFGLISLAGMYAFVYILWRNHTIALIAGLLLGFECAHLYISALATYDIICFAAFTCALPLVLLSCYSDTKQLLWTILSCSALTIAVLSKYIVAIYLPFIAVFVLWHSPRHALIGTLLISTVLTIYATLNFDQLKILYEVQILGTHDANATLTDILLRTVRQQIAILLFAAFAIVYSLLARQFDTKKFLILAAFSLPLFLYHLVGQNVISLQKHLVFSSLFLIPIIARWLYEFYDRGGRTNLNGTAVLLYVFGFAIINNGMLKTMQSSYPDVSKISTVANQIQSSDYVLSEDPYLFRYLLIDTVAQNQISETSWLDNNLDGKFERRDVQQAVWDKKFDYVFLNDQLHQNFNILLRKMLFLRDYELVFQNHYQLETMSGKKRFGAISMHRKKDVDQI